MLRASLVGLVLLLGCADERAALGDAGARGDAVVGGDATPGGMDATRPRPDFAVPDAASPLEDGALPFPDADPTEEVVCGFAAREGEQTVDTHAGAQRPDARFTIGPLPSVAGVQRATLSFTGYDLDQPGEEGWVVVNDREPIALPALASDDNRARVVELPVDGLVRQGQNVVEFRAFDRPDGSFFRVSGVRLVLEGFVSCPNPAPPIRPPANAWVDNVAPLGVSAFAGLSPDFPRDGLLEVLGALHHPFTAVLLDFAPVYAEHGRRLYAAGAVGNREVNAAAMRALDEFVAAYVAETPEARSRALQIYVFNGPGIRRPGYDRAFDLDPAAFDEAVRTSPEVRADIVRVGIALEDRLARHRGAVDIRLVPVLEDDLDVGAAQAIDGLLRSGWSGPVGRNPCACARGDAQRVGDFHERHPHSVAETRAAANELRAPDSLTNDGWGVSVDGGSGTLDVEQVPALVRAAQDGSVWYHLWYDPLQGYPLPDQGPRALRFDHPPATVLGWLADGVGATR